MYRGVFKVKRRVKSRQKNHNILSFSYYLDLGKMNLTWVEMKISYVKLNYR